MAVKAVGHDITRQCEGCHSPAGMVTGEIKGPGNAGLSPMALAGVSCDICHSVSGVTHWQTPSHEAENGSLILTPGVGDHGWRQADQARARQTRCRMRRRLPRVRRIGAPPPGRSLRLMPPGLPLRIPLPDRGHLQRMETRPLCPEVDPLPGLPYGGYPDIQAVGRGLYQIGSEGISPLFQRRQLPAVIPCRRCGKKAGDQELADTIMKQYEMAVARLKSAADLKYPLCIVADD